MARRTKKEKPLIFVFCEGESELAYTRSLKCRFSDCAVLKEAGPFPTDLFQAAKSNFEKSPRFRSNAEVTDEVWFFFDVDHPDEAKWERSQKIIKWIRKLRMRPGITVRLLMTTACIEYWLLLHYQFSAPCFGADADKTRMLKQVQALVPTYEKGAETPIFEIAENYKTAVQNGRKTLDRLLQVGLPDGKNADERDRWLYISAQTFTTVHEAIEQLEAYSEEAKLHS